MLLRLTAVLSLLVMVLALATSAEGGEQKKKKKKGAGLAGVIVSVESKDDKGTLVLKTKGKKKTPGKEEKIAFTKDTTIEKVSGKKGEKKTESAKISDLAAGAFVVVQTQPGQAGQALKIAIMQGKKKKNKAS